MKKKTVVMAWGGTWWHVFPIKSLVETIISNKEYSDKVLLLENQGNIYYNYIVKEKYKLSKNLNTFNF